MSSASVFTVPKGLLIWMGGATLTLLQKVSHSVSSLRLGMKRTGVVGADRVEVDDDVDNLTKESGGILLMSSGLLIFSLSLFLGSNEEVYYKDENKIKSCELLELLLEIGFTLLPGCIVTATANGDLERRIGIVINLVPEGRAGLIHILHGLLGLLDLCGLLRGVERCRGSCSRSRSWRRSAPGELL